ncbi:hypothetical protein PVL30_000229 [Lodderomyces elongisporus]|uniref:uncharacterized protein n=1 Tax=Lodderomyces elongisporus TaxID=36914 RepID=UPI002926957A|nr:uncharacterized protein PVL30_000229 [Lodderomyces elongisporus]WLF76527.1 hypothetical protein PVL30_000229 [Lodderomyces elongisporus]
MFYEEHDSKGSLLSSSKSGSPRNFKRYFAFGILLSVLVWGSSFLLITIQSFGNSFYIQSLQSLQSQQVSFKGLSHDEGIDTVQYARPSLKSPDLGGKLSFTKKVFDEHVLDAKLHSIQWIQTPESLYDDQGTYVINEGNDDQGELNIVVKSLANESYSYSLIDHSTFKYKEIEYTISDYVASPDLQKVILKTNSSSSWRHSSLALYWVLDVKKKEINPLHSNIQDKLSTVSWSPDSTHVAYIYNNNIFLKDTELDKTIQVTKDGSTEVFNGKPDWVYEEEVFGTDIVLWWSADGSKFAFLKSNNTDVPEFTIPFYAQKNHTDYPELVNIKYPKAGYPNPLVSVLTYDVKKGKVSNHLLETSTIDPLNRLITEVVWVGDELLVKTSNRASDLLEIFLIGQDESGVKLVRTHEAKDSWFEITSHTLYVPQNKTAGRQQDGYIDTVVVDGYNHLAYFSPPSSSQYELLTSGNWEVVGGVAAFDYTRNNVYFISTIKSSIERHIHSVNLLDRSNDGLPFIKDITAKEGYYSSSFSSGGRFLLLSDLGPGVPTQRINDLKLGKNVKEIEDNQELAQRLRDYALPEVKFDTVELTDEQGEKFLINSVETLPPNFDENKKYPVLFFIYGGPGSQQVTKRWSLSFSTVVAAELDSVVVTVDGRGTGFNNLNYKLGQKFKFIVRDKLGKYEPVDVINSAKIWAKKSYVDPDRIAVWGWSYGGFLTLKTLETDYEDSVFNYGVAIAPVTRWRLYDSIYTERYLRTPQENPEGYLTGSINNVTNFEHVKKFFIGHGSGDDNVHVQHTLQLLDEFNLAEIENFEFMIFPDSNHGMSYHNGNKVVFDRILDFFRRAFDGEFV